MKRIEILLIKVDGLLNLRIVRQADSFTDSVKLYISFSNPMSITITNKKDYHIPNILDNFIPIENVHCLIYFLLG